MSLNLKPREVKWFRKYVKDKLPSLEGKVVAVTGTTSGTGFAVVVAAIQKNCSHCFLLNRESRRAETSLENLTAEKEACGSQTTLTPINCDLMSLESVKRAGEELNEAVRPLGGLDVLINNAGIAYFPDTRTEDGLEVQMQTNFLSHFVLTGTLIDSLKLAGDNRGEARIINQSSVVRMLFSLNKKFIQKSEPNTLGGNGRIREMERYAQTKIAVAVFTYELNRRLGDGSRVFSAVAEPGLATTSILDNSTHTEQSVGLLKKGAYKVISWFANNVVPVQSNYDGAMPVATAAFSEDAKAGDFYVPGKMNNSIGLPIKAVNGGKSNWILYGEKNILGEEVGTMLWETAEEATDFKFNLP